MTFNQALQEALQGDWITYPDIRNKINFYLFCHQNLLLKFTLGKVEVIENIPIDWLARDWEVCTNISLLEMIKNFD